MSEPQLTDAAAAATAGSPELEELVALAALNEVPDPSLCLRIARVAFQHGDTDDAYRWLKRVVDKPTPFRVWVSAAAALASFAEQTRPSAARALRVALAGSYTTSQLVSLLRLAAFRRRLDLEVYESGFDRYNQELLDPGSDLYAFAPDYVIIAPHEGAVAFEPLTADVDGAVAEEASRWTSLWDAIRRNSGAEIIQHNFVIRPETSWGHLAARVPGARDEMLRSLNSLLAEAAGENVLIVDCDRLAAALGKDRWFDDRYWHLSKQAVALATLPELARHTAAVVAGAAGLSSKCIVLDLDNTLWGGVVAEDGLEGIQLGAGPEGEAYVAFQEYLLALRTRGILLAVASKNNDADAREPFERHPDTRLRLSDFAAFVANWDDKPTSLQFLAKTLNIGLDSLVFVDDNPAERELIRRVLPEVEVPVLPPSPSGFVRALSDTLLFEAPRLTEDDLGRSEQYRSLAAANTLAARSSSLEEYYASLSMKALVAPFDELSLPRVAQLVGKTNQLNLTTRRHSPSDLAAFMTDDQYITLTLRLRDRFGDHGLVGVLIAREHGEFFEIDTLLLSCRVIGRTVERELLKHLCEAALSRGVHRLRGVYLPTEKNAVARDVFGNLGFDEVEEHGGKIVWEYDISARGIVTSEFINSWSEHGND